MYNGLGCGRGDVLALLDSRACGICAELFLRVRRNDGEVEFLALGHACEKVARYTAHSCIWRAEPAYSCARVAARCTWSRGQHARSQLRPLKKKANMRAHSRRDTVSPLRDIVS